MPAVVLYDVALAGHIAAIVVAFGVTFAYPVLVPFVQRHHPRALPAVHEGQGRIGRFLITPAATVALVLGIYLAGDRHYFGELWVQVPFAILVVLLGLAGAFFAPTERRAAELARRDVTAAGDMDVRWSAEYLAVARRLAIVGALAGLLVLVAVFFMTAKP